MKNDRIIQIIIDTLHANLAGQVKPESNVSPQAIAHAIITKINFEKPYDEILNRKFKWTSTIAQK
jgi:hypothetical protein